MSYDKAKVSIDLDEYVELKKIERMYRIEERPYKVVAKVYAVAFAERGLSLKQSESRKLDLAGVVVLFKRSESDHIDVDIRIKEDDDGLLNNKQ